MSILFRRLQSYGLSIPYNTTEQQSIDFIRHCVETQILLNIEYSVFCTQLTHNVENDPEAIEEALMMAEVLETLHRRYVPMPRFLERLRRDQALYRKLLNKSILPANQTQNITKAMTVGQTIRELTPTANMSRQLLVRTRRLLIFITPFIHDLGGYSAWLKRMDTFASPSLAYAAWIFFVPRALTNVYFTARHLIPGDWMTDEEKALGWRTRLRAQWAIRQFELVNDFASLTGNLLNCFLFFGALSPIGLYVTTSLIVYDVLLTFFRAHQEQKQLQTLEADYLQHLKCTDLTFNERQHMESYLVHFRNHMAYEEKRRLIPKIMMSTLLLAFSLTLPFMALSPIIPLLGAVIALLTTIICNIAINWVLRQKPTDNPAIIVNKKSTLTTQGFFKVKPNQPIAYPQPNLALTGLDSAA